jgi:DNA-binding transcriptional LysR family regulator
MEVADVLRMETDVAVQLERPDVKAVWLGRIHIYPFASQRYAENFGAPRNIEEIRQHRVIHQQAPQVEAGALARAFNLPSIEGVVALRTNASTANIRAIELGIGVGALPTYIVAVGSDLIPLDIGIRHQVDIRMTYHPDARSIRRVATFIDWLRTLFDPKRYPWFGDEFIHPRDIGAASAAPRVETLRSILTRPREAKAG